jgi:hypothetical protein
MTMTAKTTYTTKHEGNTQTRKTARSYTHAVWVKCSVERELRTAESDLARWERNIAEGDTRAHAASMVECHRARRDDLLANGTAWGVIGFCGRRDLAEKLAAKWAWLGEIAIATAEATP